MHILVTWGTLHETAVAGLQPDDQAAHSIVQVYSVVNEPYYSIPWVTSPESNETGTGSIISGYRIITSAHLVADSRSVKVRKASANRQYEAYIVFVSHESDLAILRVHDMGFFSNTVPLEIAPGAASQKKVRVYGFPDEERLNITDGILTDNRRRLYRHSSSTLLAGELLSLIEPGYSGGPVMYDGMIVGIVMQANNAGTVAHTVPVPVIRHFLNDIEDGSYNGFPHLGLITDHRDNLLTEDNTARHGLPGICINRVADGSPAEGKIDIQDRLVSINGRTVFPDGTVELEPNVFTHYETEIEQYQVGDDIHVQILRSGEIKDIVVSLDTVRTDFMLVPPEQYDTHPRYFIFGGLIFSPLTKNILNEWNSESDNLRERISAWGTRDKEEIVAVINVLPAEVNREYREMAGWIVDSVNGFSIKSFDELYRMIESSDDPLVTFSDEQGSQIAIDRQMALASHKRILETYGITQDRSSDLLTASDNIRLISAIEHITKSSY
ncbi:MAG: trypsin-like peptidase domain-containing protein [Nitrospiraceae bacterium]|nr:MAG: trypsin-like peptidase domain-containing protein [Nitrospiraceae bacterium]